MENINIDIDITQQESLQATPVLIVSSSQQNGSGISGLNVASIPRSSQPDPSIARSTAYRVIDSEANTLVTSPINYQEQYRNQQQQKSLNPRPQDSFQFRYNPLVLADNADSVSSTSSSPSLLSAVAEGLVENSEGAGAGTSQQGNKEGNLSRARSLGINPAARQALLQQQRYQQQRQEQFLGLSQNYSNNLIHVAAAAAVAATAASETPHGIEVIPAPRALAVSPAQSGSRPTEEQEIPRPAPAIPPRIVAPPLHHIARHRYAVINTNSESEKQQQPQQQLQQWPQQQSQKGYDELLEEAIDPPPYSSIIQEGTINLETFEKSKSQESPPIPTITRPRTSIQFEESPLPESQRQQRNGRPSSVSSINAPLARAATVSTVSTNNAANANFFTHFVPKKSLDVFAQDSTPYNIHVEDGPGPASSLLNRIMGTKELKASASVRAVTKGIAERTGWARFEDNRRFLVTVSDTPGLADTEGDDEKNIPILKDYMHSVGSRLGVTAFLLVFKIDSSVDIIMTILKSFNEIMQHLPNVWDNVILVFTGCDFRRDILATKQLLHSELKHQIKEHILDHLPPSPPPASDDSFTSTSTSTSSSSPQSSRRPLRSTTTLSENGDNEVAGIPMVFLTTAENVCSFALGAGRCDCDEHSYYLRSCLKRLWYEARKMKRWVIHTEDDEFSAHG
ncbi:hypothetical protein BGX27_005363 [Mortierella sp. AM989]|nr:hypothetical protein BGX27_005363 [Mortierella sp. AM989]